jgi:hypothetical protein
VIAGYLRAVAAGDAGALESYVWRYAEASAEQPPLQKGEAQGRLAAVDPIEAGWREDAEKAVRGYFEALERRDFAGAVRWVHPAWHDGSAMPERELRSLRLLSTGFYGVQKVGLVVLFEYEVEAWARYPGLFTRQPYPRSSGRNIYYVMLAPLNPPTPAEWRIVCIGSGPWAQKRFREMRGGFPGRGR